MMNETVMFENVDIDFETRILVIREGSCPMPLIISSKPVEIRGCARPHNPNIDGLGRVTVDFDLEGVIYRNMPEGAIIRNVSIRSTVARRLEENRQLLRSLELEAEVA